MQNTPSDLETLMRVFDRMHHRSLKAEFQKRGLSEASHPSILIHLKHEVPEMGASQVEIARKIGIAPSTVAISLRRMEKAGLVKKFEDQSDLRRNFVKITEKGLSLLLECENAFDKMDRQVFKNFSPEEREQLRGFFIRMIGNLEEIGITPPEFLCDFHKACPFHSPASSEERN